MKATKLQAARTSARSFDPRTACRERPLSFDPAKLLLKFETSATAKKAKRRDIQALNHAHRLYCYSAAGRLENCGKREGGARRYCNSAACPVCVRVLRRWHTSSFAEAAHPFRDKDGTFGVVATVIMSGLRAPLGDLDTQDLADIRRRVSRALSRLRNDCPIIGGVDLSFNEVGGSREPGQYQVHISLAFLGHGASKEVRERLREKLKKCFRLEPTAKKPVVVVPLRDPVRQGSYLFKIMFSRRVSFRTSNGNRDTRDLPLKRPQLAEIIMWLDRWKPLDRLLLHHVVIKDFRMVVRPIPKRKRLPTGNAG